MSSGEGEIAAAIESSLTDSDGCYEAGNCTSDFSMFIV